MLFRVVFVAICVLGGALGWIIAAGPSATLGYYKDDIVGAYEKAGINVEDCKRQQRSLFNPSGGMPECMKGAFQDIQSKLDDAVADERFGDDDSNDNQDSSAGEEDPNE